MKVVIDTNVIVSGLLTPFGYSAEILRLLVIGSIITGNGKHFPEVLCQDVNVFSPSGFIQYYTGEKL